MSDSVRPHRQQPTRLRHPWDSPDKNTGGGCHFLLQCMKMKSESEVAQSCPTLSDPMDCSSSIHGIFQARVLEWGAIAFSATATYMNLKISITLHIVSECINKSRTTLVFVFYSLAMGNPRAGREFKNFCIFLLPVRTDVNI